MGAETRRASTQDRRRDPQRSLEKLSGFHIDPRGTRDLSNKLPSLALMLWKWDAMGGSS
jgi:hypothetical protein